MTKPPDEFLQSIAERELTLQLKDGTELPYVVRLKQPSAMADGDWECVYEIRAADNSKRTAVFGADSIQALTLALKIIAAELKYTERTLGGKFTWLGQDDLGFGEAEASGDN